VVIVERGLATASPRLIVFGLSEHDFAATENTVK
jgi:hypothetical protein